jgi:hypothetical protein
VEASVATLLAPRCPLSCSWTLPMVRSAGMGVSFESAVIRAAYRSPVEAGAQG